MENEKKKDYLLPASILISALLISVALIYNVGKKDGQSASLTESTSLTPSIEKVKPISKEDHILGNAKALVKIIEFSDLECPYCKEFYLTTKQILAAYDNKIAVVFRHYPIAQLHSKAKREAEASECAAELGGENAFWNYLDKVFEITPSNNGLDPNLLPQIAEDIGLDKTKFQACLESGKYANRVESQIKDALNSGARGTPYSIVIGPDNKKYSIPGALPLDSLKPLFDEIVK